MGINKKQQSAYNKVFSVKMNLKKRPDCKICGKPNAYAHHPNYQEPLKIIWLCKDCHRKLHLGEFVLDNIEKYLIDLSKIEKTERNKRIYTLYKRGAYTLRGLAKVFRISHPRILAIIKNMEKKKK